MKTLSTILISALIYSLPAFCSVSHKSLITSTKQIEKRWMFQNNYESLWQVIGDEEIPRRIRLSEEYRFPMIDPKITIPFIKTK